MANFSFKGWIFNLFPVRYKLEDTNKDIDNRGTFERYLKNFEDELDEGIYPFIRDFMGIFDVISTDSKYLPYISYYLGEPPSANGDIDTYRKILAYAVKIYKIKGTIESYRLLFNLYGLDVDITEDLPRRAANYDMTEVMYDDGWTYDQTCEYCSCYYIVYKPLSQVDNSTDVELKVPADIIELIHKIVCFIQPINAQLCGIYRKLTFADEITLGLEDSADVAFIDKLRYVNLLNPIPFDPTAQDIKDYYELGPDHWDDDLEQIFASIEVMGSRNAMEFYVSTPSGVILSHWVYGIPIGDYQVFKDFIIRWFSLNVIDSSLQDSGDYLYPIDPLGDIYMESAINPQELIGINKALIGFDTGIPMTGCPDPQYPMALYGVDDTIIGVVDSPEDLVNLWNSYGPNKPYGYLEHLAGCTFTLYRRSDEDNIMLGDIKAMFVTLGPDGDFNEDFEINPGGDFY